VLSTDSAGSQVSNLEYNAYGSSRSDSGTLGTDRGYTEQRLDNSGLYFYNARYYDPWLGRFISPDITVPDPANPQGYNKYTYVLNNPLKYVDPTGNRWIVSGSPPPQRLEPPPPPQGDTSYTVVWGYYVTGGAGLNAYRSVAVVESDAGDYYKIETWGGGLMLSAGVTMDVYKAGTTMITDDINSLETFGVEFSISLALFGWGNSGTVRVDSSGVSAAGKSDNEIYLGFDIGPKALLTHTSVTQIDEDSAFSDMPDWVRRGYRRGCGDSPFFF
jgi:RHS repeat-associated protein